MNRVVQYIRPMRNEGLVPLTNTPRSGTHTLLHTLPPISPASKQTAKSVVHCD